jgi:hypothetical protein
MELKQKLYNRLKEEGVRTDSVYSNVTGKGIQGRDKLQDVRPSSMNWSEIDLLDFGEEVSVAHVIPTLVAVQVVAAGPTMPIPGKVSYVYDDYMLGHSCSPSPTTTN